jgi:hypothetical protein
VHAPLLLANHGLGHSHGARFEILPETASLPSSDHVDRGLSASLVHGEPCTPAKQAWIAMAPLEPVPHMRGTDTLALAAVSPIGPYTTLSSLPSMRGASIAPPDPLAVDSAAPDPLRTVTHVMHGVHKPKECTDGTVAWLPLLEC